jgi:hypothetical protein
MACGPDATIEVHTGVSYFVMDEATGDPVVLVRVDAQVFAGSMDEVRRLGAAVTVDVICNSRYLDINLL